MKNSEIKRHRKVVVVGAGNVGSVFCYALSQSGLADEIAIIDKNESLTQGQVLDLAHGVPFFPSVSIYVGSARDYADANLIVITAGSAQRPGETRLQLLRKNASILKDIVDDIVAQESRGVILVVSNPVDVLTHVALARSGWNKGRVIGSGTVLDSARFRYILSLYCGIDAHNVHAYILGEHGDSEFAAWSMTHIAGMAIDDYCPICGRCADWIVRRREIEQKVRDSAYHIIEYKGATCFAVGLALTQIAAAVLRDQHSVLTVSTLLDGEFGINNVCLSVPCIVGRNGVSKKIINRLPDQERAALENSADVMKNAMASLGDMS